MFDAIMYKLCSCSLVGEFHMYWTKTETETIDVCVDSDVNFLEEKSLWHSLYCKVPLLTGWVQQQTSDSFEILLKYIYVVDCSAFF